VSGWIKIAVTGGRAHKNSDQIWDVLDRARVYYAPRSILLIEGEAPGADTYAKNWAKARGVSYAAVPALWVQHGAKAAGPLRNQAMVELGPEVVIAFEGGTGTADMVRKAKAAGIQVFNGEAKK